MTHDHPIAATAADYFAGMIDTYDSLIRRCVPRYEEMSERLLDYIPGEPSRILELGCGTGNHTLRFAARYPDAELVYLDASQEMLTLTGHRLAEREPDRPGSSHGIRGQFEDVAQLVEGRFDLVSSCSALHHVEDKRSLYEAIAGVMRPGGTFCLADQLEGGSASNSAKNAECFVEFCRVPGNCTEAEIQSLLDHADAHDHYTPITEHFALLTDAGFEHLDCVWRNRIWGILTATRV